MTLSNLDYAVGAVGVLTAFVYLRNSRASNLPLPPGPPSFPMIGSLLSLPFNDEPNWVWLAKLGKQKGCDIVYLNVLGTHTIMLNKREAVAELLERRSALYSNRPHLVMASELVGWNRAVPMANYATGAKEMRKLLLGSMNTRRMQEWRPRLEEEALRFLQKCLVKPDGFREHIRHMAGSTVVRLTYGYQPKEEHDELISSAESVMAAFTKGSTPGAYAVDVFPILKYFPWADFQRTAVVWRREMLEFVDAPMRFVREQMRKGVAESSFVATWLENARPEDDPSLIPWAAASLYAGGSDSTFAAISSFFVAILNYPSVQKKAQAEIDRIIGQERLPTLSDRDSLPYVEALYKEVYRWNPLGPIGIPHRHSGTKDDEYNGMRIPAGSIVIANAWAMLQDPAIYKNPTVFDPERFIGPDAEHDSEDVTFGFGRRQGFDPYHVLVLSLTRCPGILVAQSSLWIVIALTLAAYNIEPWIGEDGKPELPPVEFEGTIVRHAKPFRCRVTPRSEATRRMIENAAI